MGAKQSKRSVDISGKEGEKGGEVAAAGAGGEGRLEAIADGDVKAHINGDSNHIPAIDEDPALESKEKVEDSGTPEIEKDASTEKEAKGDEPEAPLTNGETEKTETTPPTTEDTGKKPKKEKVKKKWSLRSISFSRKDKPKHEKKQKDEEPKTNGDTEKVLEEAVEAVAQPADSKPATESQPEAEVKEEKTPETPVTEPITNGSSTPETPKVESPVAVVPAPAPVAEPTPVAPAPAPVETAPAPEVETPAAPSEEAAPAPLVESPAAPAPAPEPLEAPPSPSALPVNGLSVSSPESEVCVAPPPPLPATPPPPSVVSFATGTLDPLPSTPPPPHTAPDHMQETENDTTNEDDVTESLSTKESSKADDVDEPSLDNRRQDTIEETHVEMNGTEAVNGDHKETNGTATDTLTETLNGNADETVPETERNGNADISQEIAPVADKLANLIPDVPELPKDSMLVETSNDVAVAN